MEDGTDPGVTDADRTCVTYMMCGSVAHMVAVADIVVAACRMGNVSGRMANVAARMGVVIAAAGMCGTAVAYAAGRTMAAAADCTACAMAGRMTGAAVSAAAHCAAGSAAWITVTHTAT